MQTQKGSRKLTCLLTKNQRASEAKMKYLDALPYKMLQSFILASSISFDFFSSFFLSSPFLLFKFSFDFGRALRLLILVHSSLSKRSFLFLASFDLRRLSRTLLFRGLVFFVLTSSQAVKALRVSLAVRQVYHLDTFFFLNVREV